MSAFDVGGHDQQLIHNCDTLLRSKKGGVTECLRGPQIISLMVVLREIALLGYLNAQPATACHRTEHTAAVVRALHSSTNKPSFELAR